MGTTSRPPKWIKPQLTRLMDEAPTGKDWVHEVKYDGYRMHARIDGGDVKLPTRTGLDWSHRYRRTIEALHALPAKSAYLDGELCALGPNGVPVFSRLQAAMDEGRTEQLIFLAFDLLFLNGERTAQLPLIKRKDRLQRLFKKEIHGLRYSEHVVTDGPRFRAQACRLGLEGVISKRIDRPYSPGVRGIWVKSKCLNREEFVVVGWTDPEGQPIPHRRPLAGVLHRRWPASLRRPRRHWHVGEGTQAAGRRAGAAADAANASCRAAAARQPVRLSASALTGALGAPDSGCRSDVPDVD
jgi:DNA ligase D-like protein (predicted ligase)